MFLGRLECVFVALLHSEAQDIKGGQTSFFADRSNGMGRIGSEVCVSTCLAFCYFFVVGLGGDSDFVWWTLDIPVFSEFESLS